jgi:hypothetical protein
MTVVPGQTVSMQRFYDDEGFNFAVLIALGSAYRGLADAGEVLSTIERISEGDREAWVQQWSSTAERLAQAATASREQGHTVSARSAAVRASLYFDLASAMAPGTSDPGRFTTLWERSRDLWDQAVTSWACPVEPVRIPYEDTHLEGYLFHPAGAKEGEPLPTVILNNGSDGPVNAMWSQGGAAAVERGWRALAFDGPGQGAALHRHDLAFRHDWEAVITPVVDFLLARGDVDDERIALHGISQAGYWVPRAAAFEHRCAAVVADPGVVDVAASWETYLPTELVELLDAGEKEAFDEYLGAGLAEDPTGRAELLWRMRPFGTQSYYEAYQGARRMRLDRDTIAAIRGPVLVTDPDGEQFWPGQSRRLYDQLTCERELVRFDAAEGADWHCEVAAQALRDERVFDWLETQLA